MQLSQSNEFYANLVHDMNANESAWKRWYEDNEPEQMAIPDYEEKLSDQSDVGPFLKLLLVRCMRVDRSILMCKEFLRNTKEMGPEYVEPVTDTIESVYDGMVPEVPVIFLLSRGADPTDSIETLCRKKRLPAPTVISLGEGQEPVAVKAINAGVINGNSVLLQNCELGLGLMNELESMIEKLKDSMHPDFRLFLTALPHPEFPLGLLQMATKVTNEPPAGLKAGLLRSYTPGVTVDQDKLERVETAQWRQLLYVLCHLHSTVQERRKFGPLGWNIPYEYNTSDLQSCISFLERHLYAGPISWSTFQYMVSAVQYGGKITDSLDVRLFKTYAETRLAETCCDDEAVVPSFAEHTDYRKFIEQFPDEDSPETFGLHPNADLTYRLNEANALFRTMSDTQPKGSGSGGGVSREDVVYDKASELLGRLPDEYVEDEFKSKIRKQGGLSVPLNIFLFQEIERFQAVLSKVRFSLVQLQLAIKGEVVLTPELEETLSSIFDARVPHLWENTLTGDEFSWRSPSLGLWFTSLLARNAQYRSWLDDGRPKSFWLAGFFNPAGLLTAMKQEVTRQRNKSGERVALNDMVYVSEVLIREKVKSAPEEGIYVHGLSIEGGGFSIEERIASWRVRLKSCTWTCLLCISPRCQRGRRLRIERKLGTALFSACVQIRFERTDRYLITMIDLKCGESTSRHWTLRGVAALCNTT